MNENHRRGPIRDLDDERLLRLLEDPLAADGSDPEERALLETLGLLPAALDVDEVRPAIKARILERLDDTPRSSESSRDAEWRRYWQIAAMLVIAVGFLVLQGVQSAEVRRSTDEMRALVDGWSSERAELERLRRELETRDRQLAMLTQRGTEFCVLRPVQGQPVEAATATMVISNDRTRWFMAVEGLEACASGSCYQLLFLTESGSISGATFDNREGAPRFELSGEHEGLPSTLRGVAITRARGGEQERILFADQAMTIL